MPKKLCFCLFFILIKVTLLIIIFDSVANCAEPLAVEAMPRYLMGIEIETSAIKIKGGGPVKQIDFGSPASKRLVWRIEEDTPDVSLGATSPFQNNLEAKTDPARGFTQVAISEIAADMEIIFESFYEGGIASDLKVKKSLLNRLLHEKYKINFPHTSSFCCSSKFSIRSKPPALPGHGNVKIIKPQITYQLPLESIPAVFGHLSNLGHRGIKAFFSDLTVLPEAAAHAEEKEGIARPPAVALDEEEHKQAADGLAVAERGEDKPVPVLVKRFAANRAIPFLTANKEANKKNRTYFNDTLKHVFRAMPEGPAKGLVTLFLY